MFPSGDTAPLRSVCCELYMFFCCRWVCKNIIESSFFFRCKHEYRKIILASTAKLDTCIYHRKKLHKIRFFLYSHL